MKHGMAITRVSVDWYIGRMDWQGKRLTLFARSLHGLIDKQNRELEWRKALH